MYKILNGEVLLDFNLFDLSALTYTRRHKYQLCKQQSSVNAYKYFSTSKFVTFGTLYLIVCLMCHLQIIFEDCFIKLIYLSIQCCGNSIFCVGRV